MTWHTLINSPDFVWNTNTSDVVDELTKYDILEDAFKLNSCIFSIALTEYKNFISYIEDNVGNFASIAEYGCGNGSNLYYFAKQHKAQVYGCDISQPLVNVCKHILDEHKNNFFVGDKLPIPDNTVDVCISNSVFQYFPSESYATTVINEMLRVSKNCILITDIKDIAYRSEFKENQARRKNLTIAELNKMYENTPLLFYSRDFFLKFKNVTILDMPWDYPEVEFKSFSVMINKSVR